MKNWFFVLVGVCVRAGLAQAEEIRCSSLKSLHLDYKGLIMEVQFDTPLRAHYWATSRLVNTVRETGPSSYTTVRNWELNTDSDYSEYFLPVCIAQDGRLIARHLLTWDRENPPNFGDSDSTKSNEWIVVPVERVFIRVAYKSDQGADRVSAEIRRQVLEKLKD